VDTERLHRLAEEADAEHRDAMRTVEEDLAARVLDASPDVRASRRAFARRVGLGAGVALLSVPLLGRAAAAQETTPTIKQGDAGPPPPKAPTTEDKLLLGWAQSVELAAVAAYEAAVGTGRLSDAVVPVADLFRSHHLQHAQAHAAMAGKAALNTANPAILAQFGPLIEGANNQTELLQIAFQLESAAAATYVAALGELVGTDGAALVGSIAPIESRHATVLGDALKLPPEEQCPPFVRAADGLTPAQYPLVEA
jgi:rubrerythrin